MKFWLTFEGRAEEHQVPALDLIIFAAQYKNDTVGYIGGDDERVGEIEAHPSVEDYVASLSPSFASLRVGDRFARPLPDLALADLSVEEGGRLHHEQEDWVSVDVYALALLLSDFLEPGARVLARDDDNGKEWGYVLAGPGVVEPTPKMARVCGACGRDLNKDEHDDDCSGGQVMEVPYADPRAASLAAAADDAGADARGEIPF